MANGKRGAAEEEEDGAAVAEGPAKRVRAPQLRSLHINEFMISIIFVQGRVLMTRCSVT